MVGGVLWDLARAEPQADLQSCEALNQPLETGQGSTEGLFR